MQIKIPNKLNINIRNAMRGCGYFENDDRRSGETSYIRGFGRGLYPRFHIYIKDAGENLIFNIHIDQKRASYKGYTAHSGEYDGDLVSQEASRIEQILTGMIVE
jgi:hypothetical protein